MVSVVIPSYNRANTIERAVQSVLDQTYRDIEVIVVDDCSTDNTKAVVLGMADERLRYICLEKNSGACTARNVGVKNAKGDIIAFHDSDDEWLPDKLEKQLKCLEEQKGDICVCPLWSVDEGSEEREIHPAGGLKKEYFSLEGFLKKSYVSTQVIVGYKKCFLDEPFDEDMPRLQDWDICIRLVKKYKFVFCEEPLAVQYIQKDSISKSTAKLLAAYKRISIKYMEDYSKYPALYGKLYETIAMHEWANGQSPKESVEKAHKLNPTRNTFIKLMLVRLGLIDKYYKKKYN